MAADLYIHVLDDEDKWNDIYAFLKCTFWCNGLHGYREFKWKDVWYHENKFPWSELGEGESAEDMQEWVYDDPEFNYDAWLDCPHVWVGEVSWLKAALFDDSDTFIPDAVQRIAEIVGRDWEEGLNIIDDEMIAQVREALGLPNNTEKEGGTWYNVGTENEIVKFLEKYKGKPVFHVSH